MQNAHLCLANDLYYHDGDHGDDDCAHDDDDRHHHDGYDDDDRESSLDEGAQVEDQGPRCEPLRMTR